MKAEINNENKAKFFAQYWGQRIINWNNNSVGIGLVNSGYINDVGIWIELKSLSDISNEYAIEVAIFEGYERGNSAGHNSFNGKRIVTEECNKLSQRSADFLRSRGYLVPWLGLSCEELIEAGWAKYV